MKILWEVDDIKPGRRVKLPRAGEISLIGYRAECVVGRYVLISLSDGNVTLPFSKEDLAQSLSAGGYWPLEFLEVK